MENKNLSELFNSYLEQKEDIILELFNSRGFLVAAIYTKTVHPTQLVVSETNNSDKYALYIDGIFIYFESFRKIIKN